MSLPLSFQNLNRKIFSESHHSLVFQLGQQALSDTPLSAMMTQGAALVAQMLSVEYVWIWELEPNKKHISLRASLGRHEEGPIVTSENPKSLESITLLSQYPIVIEDLSEEIRFDVSSLLKHGVVSGVSTLVGTVDEPLGVIEVFSHQTQNFSQDEILLLQMVANILGLAIQRVRLKVEKQELQAQLVKAQTVMQAGRHEWDHYEIKNRLIESREKERLRLAQDLHDIPIQDLYGLIYQMDELKDHLKEPEGDLILHEYNHVLHRIVNSLRAICRDLRPPSLSAFGLEVAIRDHVEKFHDQNPNIHIHLQLMHDRQVLSDSLRLNLFRVYQQAINNVARHAEASDVYIRFGWDENVIVLEVEDNGKGFGLPKFWVELVRQDHFGLVGLAERMESIRGKLEIVSSPGNGTLIRAIVPRPQE